MERAGLQQIAQQLAKSVRELPTLHRLGKGRLPNRDDVACAIDDLMQLVFPGYFGGPESAQPGELAGHLAASLDRLADKLVRPVVFCFQFENDQATASDCTRRAEQAIANFFERLPHVRELVADDVSAHFDGDPAAVSTEEILLSYPGLHAIVVQRLAHELHQLEVPLLPRIMTEIAHTRTGIDIHPGATLGRRLFIDHGTGVVIGETCQLGTGVKIYQGVTLGALALAKGQALRGVRRHPTIENDVTLYAGATILGGDTVIGQGSLIGGNVFLTESVPPNTTVVGEPPVLRFKSRGQRGADAEAVMDFQI